MIDDPFFEEDEPIEDVRRAFEHSEKHLTTPPQRVIAYHVTRHDPTVPITTCWRCGKAQADCRRKIRFTTWQEANQWVTESNHTRSFDPPVTRYRCRWCNGWHMCTATRKHQRRRAERARRKWRIAQLSQ